jgi:hypothetical protein
MPWQLFGRRPHQRAHEIAVEYVTAVPRALWGFGRRGWLAVRFVPTAEEFDRAAGMLLKRGYGLWSSGATCR